MKNHTWDLVSLPKGRKLVHCKWIYRTKYAAYGSVDKHKVRLVAKGFSQVEGIDYSETFAPVAKMNSIHLVLLQGIDAWGQRSCLWGVTLRPPIFCCFLSLGEEFFS